MQIRVTRKHIDRGVAGNCGHCPLALALSEKVHHKVDAYYGFLRYLVRNRGEIYQSDLSEEAYIFMTRFDDGKKVKPFTFEAKFHRIVSKDYDWRVKPLFGKLNI